MFGSRELDKMAPDTIFLTGIAVIPHPWYGLSPNYPDKVRVKWVAIRGTVHDWAVYHSFDTNLEAYANMPPHKIPDRMVAGHGSKMHDEELVAQLTGADESAMALYRH
jgi:hypothetical protein